jgi:hypothetical protein
MVRNSSEIIDYTIGATDGQIGRVTDFLFDDNTWLVRWLVIDTGFWLSGRKVLLPPSVLGHFSAIGDQFSVRLTMQQVKDSPDVDTDLPVSRFACWPAIPTLCAKLGTAANVRTCPISSANRCGSNTSRLTTTKLIHWLRSTLLSQPGIERTI